MMTKPKYEIGDRIPQTKLEVCGVKILSNGTIRYWLFAEDNGIIANENELHLLTAIVNPTAITNG